MCLCDIIDVTVEGHDVYLHMIILVINLLVILQIYSSQHSNNGLVKWFMHSRLFVV